MPSGLPTLKDVFTDPSPGSATTSPSHSSLHEIADDAIEKLEAVWGLTRGSVINLANYTIGDGVTNDTDGVIAACADVPVLAGVLLVPPGRYYMTSAGAGVAAVTIQKAAFRMVGLGGKPYMSRTRGDSTNGAFFIGGTPGMTLFKFDKLTGNQDTTHTGPRIRYVGFADPSVVTNQTAITAASASGTLVTISFAAAHGFVNGRRVYIQDLVTATGDTSYQGDFTITAVNDTAGTVGGVPPYSIRYVALQAPDGPGVAPFGIAAYQTYNTTMTLLQLASQTRWRIKDNHFHGGLVGYKCDPIAGDMSWGKFEDNSVIMNGTGVLLAGKQGGTEGAQSVVISDGDWGVAAGQIGIDGQSRATMPRIRGMKFDVGMATTGENAICINLREAPNFYVGHVGFEVDCRKGIADGVRIGGAGGQAGGGQSQGTIEGLMFQGGTNGPQQTLAGLDHTTARRTRGIYIDGPDATNKCFAITIEGGQYLGMQTCIELGPNTEAITVIGGGVGFADWGIKNAGDSNAFLAFARGSGQNTGFVPLLDSGTRTQQLWIRDGKVHSVGVMDFATPPAAAAPTAPPAGIKRLGVNPGTGKLSVYRSDNTLASIEESGPGASGLVVAQTLARVDVTGPVTPETDAATISYQIPANSLAPGTTYRLTAYGWLDTPASGVVDVKTKFVVGASVKTTRAVTPNASLDLNSGLGWEQTVLVVCTGVPTANTANLEITHKLNTSLASSAAARMGLETRTTPVVVNPTNNITIALWETLAAGALAGQIMHAEYAQVELVKA